MIGNKVIRFLKGGFGRTIKRIQNFCLPNNLIWKMKMQCPVGSVFAPIKVLPLTESR